MLANTDRLYAIVSVLLFLFGAAGYVGGRFVGRERAIAEMRAAAPPAPAQPASPSACTLTEADYEPCLALASTCLCSCKPVDDSFRFETQVNRRTVK